MKYSRPQLAVIIAFLLASADAGTAQAQGNPTQSQGDQSRAQNGKDSNSEVTSEPIPQKFWEIRLSDGGSYMVALGRITSIAKHEYIVDAAVRVNEVTISAEGSTVTRFYFLAPVTDKSPSSAGQAVIDRLNSASKELASRTNQSDLVDKVAKSYPEGTHSHNVEFRLKSLANVKQIYDSVHGAWFDGKGARVSISNKK